PPDNLRLAHPAALSQTPRLLPGAGTIPVSVTTMMSGDGLDSSRDSDPPNKLSRPGSPTLNTNPTSANERVNDTDGSSASGRMNGKASRLDPIAARHAMR